MAEKTYVVKATAFGHMLNREVVEKAAMEGRTVPPLVKYLSAADTVKLDPSSETTKRALASGSIEEPGASDERLGERLQAEMDALKVRQDALRAQMPSSRADGPSLADLQAKAEALGIARWGNKSELSERIAAHEASLSTAG